MSPELLFNIIVFAGAFITIPIARMRYGTWLTSGLLYSSGWIIAVVCYHYLNLVKPDGYEIPTSSFVIGSKLVFWGHVGVILGHLFFGPPKIRYREFYNYFSSIGHFLNKYYLWICGAVFAVGFIAFAEKMSSVGFSIFTLSDIRQDHVHSSFSVFQRLGIHGGLILGIFVSLSAVDDSLKERVNVRRILAIIIALLPLALSQGSRKEFMNPVITYALTTFLVMQVRLISGHRIKWNLLGRMYMKFLPVGLALLFIFTVYGQLRGVGSKEIAGKYTLFSLVDAPLQLSKSICSWYASSLYSVGPITAFEDVTFPRMHGRIYFEPLFKVPEKLGLIQDKSALLYLARQDAFNNFNEGIVAFTPGTMGKILTREVGLQLAPYFGGLAMFFAVAMSNRWKRNSIFGFTLVSIFASQALMSSQTLRGFTMIVMYQLIFAFCFDYWHRNFRRNLKA